MSSNVPWSVEVFNILYSAQKLLKRRKFRSRTVWIIVLRKILLEHFTVIFATLNNIFV